MKVHLMMGLMVVAALSLGQLHEMLARSYPVLSFLITIAAFFCMAVPFVYYVLLGKYV